MTPLLRNIFVVARRDFLSIVATPTFLLFLLAPLFMIGMGALGGFGASQLADSARGAGRVVAVVDPGDVEALREADARLRDALPGGKPATLELRVATSGVDPVTIAQEKGRDTYAVMIGPLASPRIVEREANSRSGRYLALLATEVLRARAAGPIAPAAPQFESLTRGGTSIAAQQSIGFGAVFVIFLLTLLLAGQSVGMLAEEKGNKVIEILAAAVPLESVFLGKLIGLLGVAILFIAFWMAMAIGAGLVMMMQIDPAAAAQAGASAPQLVLAVAPATGWPFFILAAFLYFVMAFLLLGAVFLGVGAQAATVREIQMLSLPITIFQVAMLSLSSAAANAPGSRLATIAQLIPFSSPLAMAARAATDDAKAVHLLALGWQAIWVALVVYVSVRLFRSGVLSGRRDWRLLKRTKGVAADTAARR